MFFYFYKENFFSCTVKYKGTELKQNADLASHVTIEINYFYKSRTDFPLYFHIP